MGAYLTLLAILAAWTVGAFRDERSLRPYAVIYGINVVVANTTEGLFAILLDTYTFGSFTNFFLVTVGIEPLLGSLYARYSDHWPVPRAFVGAAILGGLVEPVFLMVGAFRYDRGWHPLLTVIFFTGYFLWTWWLTKVINTRDTVR